jgi:putative phosphoesterase
MPTRVLVISDTHVTADRVDGLVDRLRSQLERADVIVHAGDITDVVVLERLGEFAPVHAVLGNNDHGADLPEQLVVAIDGCEVAMIHDSGQASGRAGRLRRWFPSADVVVFGHSHLPWNESDIASDGHVQRHLNPGSATQRRLAPECTVAWIDIAGGEVVDVRHEPA